MRAWRTKGFDKLSPNGGHLFSVSPIGCIANYPNSFPPFAPYPI